RDAHARTHLPRGPGILVHGPEAHPERWLPGADATILPTRYDPAANSTVEALACDVPPITSARDGASEIVPDPRLVVADPGDVDGFAAAIRLAWGLPHDGRWRAAAAPWTVGRNADRMIEIYTALLGTR
ncbi:MAG: glycosyltransferase, partial [Deltaproteobacteria bacterium]|nr:glycosyltransferase [Deltaproteobacteria bacterium]